MDDSPNSVTKSDTEFRLRNLFTSFWTVTAGLATKPSKFFSNLSTSKRYWPPLLYLVVIVVLTSAIAFGIDSILGADIAPIKELEGLNIPEWFIITALILMILSIPVAIIGFILIIHLGVLVFARQHNKGFNLTWKTVIYVSGFIAIPMAVISYAGPLSIPLGLGVLVWEVFLTIVGIKFLHNTEWGQAILAVIIPQVVAFIGLVMVGFVLAPLLFISALFMLPMESGSVEGGTLASYEEIQERFGETPLVPSYLPESFREGHVTSGLDGYSYKPGNSRLYVEYINKQRNYVIRVDQHIPDGRLPESRGEEVVSGITVHDLDTKMDWTDQDMLIGAEIDGVWVEVEGELPRQEMIHIITTMEPTTDDTFSFGGQWHDPEDH